MNTNLIMNVFSVKGKASCWLFYEILLEIISKFYYVLIQKQQHSILYLHTLSLLKDLSDSRLKR